MLILFLNLSVLCMISLKMVWFMASRHLAYYATLFISIFFR